MKTLLLFFCLCGRKIMGKLLEIVKNPSVVGGYINGVVNAITNRKNIYYLTFHRKIDGGWYNVEQKAE